MNRLNCLRRPLAWLAASSIVVALAGCPAARQPKSRPLPKKETTASAAPTEKGPAETTAMPAAEPAATKEPPAAKPDTEPAPAEENAEKPRDLGLPLVDNVDGLQRLDPKLPVWLDKKNKQVVFLGEVCRADYPLEFFVTYRDRAYEAIIQSEVRPSIVHAGLLELGAKEGHPVQFQPEFVAPSGTEVAIEVRWKDAQGKVQSCPPSSGFATWPRRRPWTRIGCSSAAGW